MSIEREWSEHLMERCASCMGMPEEQRLLRSVCWVEKLSHESVSTGID